MKSPHLSASSVRVGAALLLAGACFQAGRWTGQLEYRTADAAAEKAVAEATDAAPAQAAPVETGPSLAAAVAGTTAQGDPVGQTSDVITPLNVRDPSALVMRPMDVQCSPLPLRAVEPPKVKPLKKPLPEGKLLDLMKKHQDKPDEVKVY